MLDALIPVLFVVAYFVLMRWVLPHFVSIRDCQALATSSLDERRKNATLTRKDGAMRPERDYPR